MYFETVPQTDIRDFRQIVNTYWHKLMPHNDVVKNPEGREAYCRECFT
jgi:hypothetical protein